MVGIPIGADYIYGTRWTTKQAALGRQPGVAQTDKWVIWKTKDNLWTKRLKNAGFHEVFSTDNATETTSCGFKIKGWWRKGDIPTTQHKATDLLSLNDSKVSLQVIQKWTRCGANLNLSKTPDADVLKENSPQTPDRVFAGAATLWSGSKSWDGSMTPMKPKYFKTSLWSNVKKYMCRRSSHSLSSLSLLSLSLSLYLAY